jgi:hypothetical protein
MLGIAEYESKLKRLGERRPTTRIKSWRKWSVGVRARSGPSASTGEREWSFYRSG